MKEKHLHTWKNLKMNTEGAHSKLLLSLFEMPHSGIMSVRLKKNNMRGKIAMPVYSTYLFMAVSHLQADMICNGDKNETMV